MNQTVSESVAREQENGAHPITAIHPTLFANYQYSLSGPQQQQIQQFLRFLPARWRSCNAWALLHHLTYPVARIFPSIDE